MKVLVVHPYMKPLGGGEWVCLNVLEALLEKGFETVLLTEQFREKLLEDVFNFRSKGLVTFPFKRFKPRFKLQAYQWLVWHYGFGRSVKSRLGHFDLEFSTQDVAFNFGAGKTRVAYVHFPYFNAHLYPDAASNRLLRLYYAPVVKYWRRHLNGIDLLLCNSEFTMLKVEERWGRKGVVVYPPVDVRFFNPEALSETERDDAVISVGRITPVKNFELVLDVARMLPGLKFVIAGVVADVNYYYKLLGAKPGNVHILPNIRRDRLRRELWRAKVYLHPMINEHFGISIVEAMAAGCVPVVHNSGGAREAVRGVGYLYNTPGECASMIERALKYWRALKEEAIKRAASFDREIFKNNIKKILDSL